MKKAIALLGFLGLLAQPAMAQCCKCPQVMQPPMNLGGAAPVCPTNTCPSRQILPLGSTIPLGPSIIIPIQPCPAKPTPVILPQKPAQTGGAAPYRQKPVRGYW